MPKTVIVHDGRLTGGLGATVLARVLHRASADGITVYPLPPNSTSETFWVDKAADIKNLPRLDESILILFGITFLDIDDDLCVRQLLDLHAACAHLEIWTHRWPDGFSDFAETIHKLDAGNSAAPEVIVKIPPNDIIYDKHLGILLSSDEKRLLRLTLYSAGIIARNDAGDDLLLSALSQWITKEGATAWDRLVDVEDLAVIIDEVLHNYEREENLFRGVTIEEVSPEDNFVEVSFDIEVLHNRKIEMLDSVLDKLDLSEKAVVLAWFNADRVLLYRRDRLHEYPSIRWMVENRFEDIVPQELRFKQYGPQNAAYFPITLDQKSRIRQPMRELAKACARSTYGGRYLQASLARDIADIANSVIRSVDLRKKYTNVAEPTIKVDAAKIYELLHVGSRTGRPRRTLTLPVDVVGAAATAFVFRGSGYNFQKIERLLEGALIGLKHRNLQWLGEDSVPDRLRIDVRPVLDEESLNANEVARSIQGAPMESVPATGLVEKDSLIGRFLDALQMNSLVSYAESETIGPSVAHALTLLAVAAAVAEKEFARARVLDLFSGSGVANKLLRMGRNNVVSVDLYVAASSIGLEAEDLGLWLKADARKVLDRFDPILERKFDVIGLDPPHSELVELLFGTQENQVSLVELIADRADLMVMYQGHTTQRGRLHLISRGLMRAGWECVEILQVEEELIVIAGKGPYWGASDKFQKLINGVPDRIHGWASRNNLEELNIHRISMT